ncbi:hypothetical protein ILUMI_24410 [Ignelater luminosus]|uniref:Uncharacterized protein n=1 Tax=Ignelater luminosus TaxID=2038154 RepID=A0A8K0C746_IGNLU|nr:hypothetical protein ILUMI_24410 [Ignelater luminosus]
MRKKSDVKDKLRKVLQHTKTLGHPIRKFLSDNGGEFDNQKGMVVTNATEFGLKKKIRRRSFSKKIQHVKLPLRDILQNEEKLEELKSPDSPNSEDPTESDWEESPNENSSTDEDFFGDRSALRTPFHLNDYITFSKGIITNEEIPKSYKEAVNRRHRFQWKQAMGNEMKSLKACRKRIQPALWSKLHGHF